MESQIQKITIETEIQHQLNKTYSVLKVKDFDKFVKEFCRHNIQEYCVKNNESISTAESMTGGLIANLFVGIKGASKFFKGSLVCYSEESKISILGSEWKEKIEKTEGIDQEITEELAKNISKNLNSTISIAITGNAEIGLDGNRSAIICIYLKNKNKMYCLSLKCSKGDSIIFEDNNIIQCNSRNKFRRMICNIAIIELMRILDEKIV